MVLGLIRSDVVKIPLSDFLCGIHDIAAHDRKDAAHVAILAHEVREMLEGADSGDENVKSLLESCDAAERVALRLYNERGVDINKLIKQPGRSSRAENSKAPPQERT